jgi:type IV pilus assembly protein PilV
MTETVSINKEILTDSKGFTLVEILFALTIFALGILGVASMQVAAMAGSSKAAGDTEAATWAVDKMEELMSTDYDDITSSGSPTTQGRYTVSWTVASDSPFADTKTVSVSVTWRHKGVQKRIILKNIIANV